MNGPTMFAPLQVASDTVCLPAYDSLPGLGVLPVNSFVLRAAEPLLVDTGLAALAGPYLEALGRTIDPATRRCAGSGSPTWMPTTPAIWRR